MRLWKRRAAEDVARGASKAHPRRSSERQAEIEALQFLLSSITKRHTWDRSSARLRREFPPSGS
jgi:hypothetical protein